VDGTSAGYYPKTALGVQLPVIMYTFFSQKNHTMSTYTTSYHWIYYLQKCVVSVSRTLEEKCAIYSGKYGIIMPFKELGI
jgi:hypothetical protein